MREPGNGGEMPEPGKACQTPEPGDAGQMPKPGNGGEMPGPGKACQMPEPGNAGQMTNGQMTNESRLSSVGARSNAAFPSPLRDVRPCDAHPKGIVMLCAYRRLIAGLILLGLCAGSATARTLDVGPAAPYKKPSEAIAAADNGDTIRIAAGQYFDCIIIKQSVLTIQGSGPDAVMTDTACQGKALIVEHGDNITIRNLTLQRARVPDGNGAGIRYEGGNLTIDHVRFINNQDGILGADSPDGTARIVDSEFLQNGTSNGSCAYGIYFGHMKLVHIERTRFFETRQGHQIKSRALRTEVIGCNISDGPNGTSSYLIEIPNGGSLIARNNQMEKGPKAENRAYAISLGAEGVDQPTDQVLIEHNTFANDQARPTTFVRNLTATPVELIGNVFTGEVRPFEGDGATR